VAVVGAVAGAVGEVDLIEVVKHAVHGVEHGPVRVVLPAAVLVHEMVGGGVLERFPAEFVSWRAGPADAAAQICLVAHTGHVRTEFAGVYRDGRDGRTENKHQLMWASQRKKILVAQV
jgi:hypothetical protein